MGGCDWSRQGCSEDAVFPGLFFAALLRHVIDPFCRLIPELQYDPYKSFAEACSMQKMYSRLALALLSIKVTLE